jgi:hypothetical protein
MGADCSRDSLSPKIYWWGLRKQAGLAVQQNLAFRIEVLPAWLNDEGR